MKRLTALMLAAALSGTYLTTVDAQPPNFVDAAGLGQLRGCEQNDNPNKGPLGYASNTGNGFHGAYQFVQSTWDSMMSELGHIDWIGVRAGLAPPWLQDQAAFHLWNTHGSQHWPQCQHKVTSGTAHLCAPEQCAEGNPINPPIPNFTGVLTP